MQLVISREQTLSNLYSQIGSFFSITEEEKEILNSNFDAVLDKCEKCFSGTNNKYFFNSQGEVRFNSLHSVQYMTFLYFMAHTLYLQSGG